MYTPHVITLVNAVEGDDFALHYSVTVLRGVFLDTTQRRSVGNAGTQSAGTATLYIPATVRATDLLSGAEKPFVPCRRFHRMPDISKGWTLETADSTSSAPCYIIKGEVHAESWNYERIREDFDGVYDVQAVRELDFGSPGMQHWQVECV